MKQGKYFRIPQEISDLKELWEQAAPVESDRNLPPWVWAPNASTYRHVGSASSAQLSPDEKVTYDAELQELQAAGLIVAEPEDGRQHRIYVTVPHTPYFVDETHVLSIGPDAATRLRSKNDAQFLQGSRGVIEVTTARWREAQRYERRSWMEGDGLSVAEDRNAIHEKYFEGYSCIRGMHFDNAIEIGCGPFTNMIRILKQVECRNVWLLDPLIEDYLTHPRCSYKNRRLLGFDVHTVPEAIESFSTRETFDLLVMINVLEHCFSVPKAFGRILSLMRPEAILVFHDKFLKSSEVGHVVRSSYDAGHPLRFSEEPIREFISQNYTTLFNRRVLVPIEVHTFDSVYFIGRKRAP